MGQTETGEKKVTIWNRTFVCCILANVFFCFSHFFTSPLVSTYAAYLGAGATIVGMLSGLYFGIAFAMRPVAGPLVTMGNKKILMFAAFLLGAVINVLYAVTGTIPLFVFTRILHGVQYSIIGSLVMTVASASLPKEKIGSGIGVFGVSGVFGTALGPTIGIGLRSLGMNIWGEVGAYRMVFLASALCCVFALVPTMLIQNQRALTKDERKALGPWYKNIVTLPAIPSAILMLLYSMTYILFNTFLVPFAAQYGIPGITSFFTIYALCTLVTRPISGRLLDRHGPRILFYPCTALFVVGLIIAGTATTLPMMIVCSVVCAIGWGSLQPTIQAMAMASVPTEKGGVASNTNYFGLDAGYFIGPTLGGLVYAATGSYHTMFLVGIIPVVIGLIVFTVTYPLRERGKYREELARRQAAEQAALEQGTSEQENG